MVVAAGPKPEEAPSPKKGSGRLLVRARAQLTREAMEARDRANLLAKEEPEARRLRRVRAISTISRFAGEYAQQARLTKWIVDMVVSIDAEYYATIVGLQQQVASLEATLGEAEGRMAVVATQSAKMMQDANDRVLQAQEAQRHAEARTAEMEAEQAAIREALENAETAATAASRECEQLQQAIQVVTEEDSKARKALASRSYLLKEKMLSTKRQLRLQRNAAKQQGELATRLAATNQAALDRQRQHYAHLETLAGRYDEERQGLLLQVEHLHGQLQLSRLPGRSRGRGPRARTPPPARPAGAGAAPAGTQAAGSARLPPPEQLQQGQSAEAAEEAAEGFASGYNQQHYRER